MRWRGWRKGNASGEDESGASQAEPGRGFAGSEPVDANHTEAPPGEPSRERRATRTQAWRPTPPATRSRTGSRTGLAWRTRAAGAAAVGALGSGVLIVARLVMTVAAVIALLIGLAIVLRDVGANATNTIVKDVHDGANFFAGSFTGLISFRGHPGREITVDWGIALVVYLIVGALIAGMIARVGRGGLRFGQRHRTVASH
jgi:hypothetical protein